ncbi:MAG TPA: hypothetical protein VJL80_09745 [Aeromicrobium sp.]|nr:hypothetical protein [Aeromicrobium sp.]HKY58308.1 hypothetical protein [Aeromicrobium sp.]
MSKTLAELRAMTAPKLPTRIERLCLNLELLAETERLQNEKEDLLVEVRRSTAADPEERQGPPRKIGAPAKPVRVAEIDAELTDLYDQMREFEGELLLRGIEGGRWQEWKDANPPRKDNESDERHGYGIVNATALMADLGRFAAAWNGEEFAEGDWDGWFAARVAPADLAALVMRVVEMHEARVSVPKAQGGSSPTPSPGNDAASPSS